MENLSRRSLFGAAAGAGGALFGGVAAASQPDNDAQLIALGHEFDRLYAETMRLEQVANTEYTSSLKILDSNFANPHFDNPEYFAAYKQSNIDDIYDAADAALKKLDGCYEKMQKIQASTLAGMAAKARGLMFAVSIDLDMESYGAKAVTRFVAELDAAAIKQGSG